MGQRLLSGVAHVDERCGVLHPRNITRWTKATSRLGAVVCAGLITPMLASSAMAQEAGILEQLAEKRENPQAGAHVPPSPAEAMKIYRAVADIVHAWNTENVLTAAGEGGGEAFVPTFSGIDITLRLDGKVIGRGEALEPPADMPRIGLAPADWKWSLVREALRQAMEQAELRLPKTNDAFADEARKLAAKRIMISLELSGEWTPIAPATWLDASAMLEPGIDGVAARKAGTVGSAIFPATMLATNRMPPSALAGVAAEAIGEGDGGGAAVVDKPSVFTKRHNIALYRFRTTHLAQAAAEQEPVFLTRGQRVVELNTLGRGSLADAADKLADHLLSRIVEEDVPAKGGGEPTKRVRVIGAYEPWTGKASTEAMDARPDEMALMAYALVRYSRLETLSEARQKELLAAADKLLRATSQSTPDGILSRENVSVTLANLCFEDVDGRLHAAPKGSADEYPELYRLFWAREYTSTAKLPLTVGTLMLFEEVQRFIDDQSRSIRPGPRKEQVTEFDARLREVYAQTPPSQLVTYMPWLGWAEQQLALAKKHAAREPGLSWKEFEAAPLPDIPAAAALRQMREQVWEHQLSEQDTGAMSADMAGGIVFTKGTGTPLPTWQTARPVAFFGSMLVDDRLTEETERPLELAKLLKALRFLRQLQADESEQWMFPTEGTGGVKTLGGVRASVWDQSMPLDASSFTLMAYAEALKALDEMGKE